jgi:23S rRNA (pseudouridine1915-N3)-methyltransferase
VKLRLIAVGRDKNDAIVAQAAEYMARLERYFPVETVEVKEEPAKASTPIARVRAVEAERIAKALGGDDYAIALDERGKEVGSVELAKKLERFAREGKKAVSFVIGGPNGLDPEFVQKTREVWSLSKLTLPHRIARLIVAEQLYRAATIMRGEPYHK